VWDAQKMEIVQSLSNRAHMRLKYISTSCFHENSGTLLLGTQRIFKYKMKVDHETKIQVDKQHTVSSTYMKQLKNTLMRTQQIKSNVGKDDKNLVDKEKLEYEIFDHKKLALSKHQDTVKRRMTIMGQKITP
jgi:hypothetical protein